METIKYKDHTIAIDYDTDCTNPRKDYDHLGQLILWGKLSHLSDEDQYTQTHTSMEEYEAELDAANVVYQKVYCYEHSGIALSTSPFSCRWDSWQAGFIYMNQRVVDREFNENRESAMVCLESEVNELSHYLNGEVYGYTIRETGDSCWGFNGLDEVIAEAKRTVDYIAAGKSESSSV